MRFVYRKNLIPEAPTHSYGRVLTIGLSLLGLLVALFIVRQFNHGEVLGSVIDTTPPPPPTALDANFEKQVNECLIPIANIYGYTLRINSGFRTVEEQEKLYEQGRTVDGHIVTHTVRSIHNYGFAVDVVDRFRGYEVDWERLGRIGFYCGLQQGDEEYDEKVHFQHRDGLTIEQFEAGKRPRPLELPCSSMEARARSGEALTMDDLRRCSAPAF